MEACGELINIYFFCHDLIQIFLRQTYLRQMQEQKAQCTVLSFWVQTKPQSQWPLEMLSTTLCTSQLGMSTTPLGVCIEMLWS